eukprot:TRINITY_DN12971_c0_g1_i1.p1 TRINITY_DN12971_c0_g1~~TRINITY_DN12971_c0_g1_i1.p1  ORF type:complete len:246 (+),score=47.45 TRINITY_DN12971_c0_g1_i1:54-791(+)
MRRSLLRTVCRNIPVAQRRWDVMDDMRAISDKRADVRTQLMREAKDLYKGAMHSVESELKVNEDIPKNYTEFVITHIGSMDGEDIEESTPKRLSRKEAFALAARDGYDVCFIERGPEGEAICRLRYLKMYTRRQTHLSTLDQRADIQRRLRDSATKFPSTEHVVTFKASIGQKEVRKKGMEAITALQSGKKARIIIRLFASEDHAEAFLTDLLGVVQQQATEHGLKLQVLEKNVHKKGGGCLLVV